MGASPILNHRLPDAEETARQLANPNSPLASLTLKNQMRWYEGDLPGADDVTFRETFALLDALFASVVGNVPGAKPLLTLPVN